MKETVICVACSREIKGYKNSRYCRTGIHEKNCKNCNKIFYRNFGTHTTKNNSHWWNNTHFCSICIAASKNYAEKECLLCAKKFRPKNPRTKFCYSNHFYTVDGHTKMLDFSTATHSRRNRFAKKKLQLEKI